MASCHRGIRTSVYITATHSVIDYLGRYSHRIALSNARLPGMEQGKVKLRY
ncbi:MAG TPA: hypothetical protein ENJ84_10435, partial [Gammaproteobacteria bacterium]|nr:hypothetical protein [Gammaproteobacteria bacterium]